MDNTDIELTKIQLLSDYYQQRFNSLHCIMKGSSTFSVFLEKLMRFFMRPHEIVYTNDMEVSAQKKNGEVAGASPAFLIKKFTVQSRLCMIYALLASFAA